MSPRKRRRLDLDALEDAWPDIIGELDLEICFRERLAKSLESRITWALILRESLQLDQTGSTTPFKDVAIESLSAIEAPSEFLFVREASPPPRAFQPQTLKASRPPPKPKFPTRNPNTTFLYIRSADLEPLPDENHIQTYLLRCPTCSRTAFTSLQGLLNHARITHSQEWSSHDECVRACAVLDAGIDISAGIEVGLGPVGMLPGLRSLFQRAVRANGPLDIAAELPGSQPSQELTSGSHLARTLGLHKDTPALAPFLGKQAIRKEIKEWDNGVVDIDGFEDDSHSATHDTTNNLEKRRKKKRWRMPYTHRNDVDNHAGYSHVVAGDNALSILVHGDKQMDSNDNHFGSGTKSLVDGNIQEETLKREPTAIALAPGIGLSTLSTRFRFVARIVITDRSLWIPLDQRKKTGVDHTHMWMISVDSPSYSHHITTILTKMTVTSCTDPGKFPALTRSDPPFAVISTTSEPFLAKVEMRFSSAPDANGQMTSQTMVLEQWVELDLVKLTTPAVGEEQVVDIELDKATVLMPIRTDYTPIDAKVLWNLDSGPQEPTGRIDGDANKYGVEAKPTEGYGKILNSLVGNFPMTLKDTPRGRPPKPPLPYKLVSTPAQLKNLVLGRRKAIEWGRARTLRDAYTKAIQDPQMSQQNIPLTTADVFIWLSEEGHFLKRPPAIQKPMNENDCAEVKSAESWCPICGQGVDAHLMADVVKKEAAHPVVKAHSTVEDETKADVQSGNMQAPAFPYSCSIVPMELHNVQTPIVDVHALLGPRHNSPQYHYGMAVSQIDDPPRKSYVSRAAHLVAACDPHLCLFVERVLASLKLSAFSRSLLEPPASQHSPQFPLDIMGMDKVSVENCLAPYAMLGLATQQFVRGLVKGGLEVTKEEKGNVARLAAHKRRRRVEKEKDVAVSMLTPAHVLNSVLSRGEGRRVAHSRIDVAILGCLARLRVPADRGKFKMGSEIPDNAQERTVRVKMEEP